MAPATVVFSADAVADQLVNEEVDKSDDAGNENREEFEDEETNSSLELQPFAVRPCMCGGSGQPLLLLLVLLLL